MPTEICHDRPRVNCEGANSPRFAAPIEFDRKQNIRGFRLGVGLPPLIGATLEIRIVEVNSAALVSTRRKGNHPRSLRTAECWEETHSQSEMPEMVRGKLGLISPNITCQRRCHDAGVVNEDVERTTACKKRACEGIDGSRIKQIQLALFHA